MSLHYDDARTYFCLSIGWVDSLGPVFVTEDVEDDENGEPFLRIAFIDKSGRVRWDAICHTDLSSHFPVSKLKGKAFVSPTRNYKRGLLPDHVKFVDGARHYDYIEFLKEVHKCL